MNPCIFCKIASKTTPTPLIFENADTVAFRDLHPVAPTHVLVIPKSHIDGVHASDAETLGHVLSAAREVADSLGLGSGGYRLVFNQGPDAGQSVSHLHCHILGGRAMGWPPF